MATEYKQGEFTEFERLPAGTYFSHNKIGYRKIGSKYAEKIETEYTYKPGQNVYFDGCTKVLVQ